MNQSGIQIAGAAVPFGTGQMIEHLRRTRAITDPYPSFGTLLLRQKRGTGVYSDAGSTPAVGGGNVQQWNGQNGTDNATQTTAGNQPVYQSNGSLLFDGAGDVLNVALGASYTGTTLTAFIVAKRVSRINNAGMLSVFESGGTSDTGSTAKGLLEWEFSGDNLVAYREGLLSIASHPGNGVAYVYATRFDGSNNKTWVNGSAALPVASSGSWNIGKITIGSRPGAEGTNAYIFDVLLYSNSLSDSDVVAVSTQLNTDNADIF